MNRVKIAPSLLNADFGYLADAVQRAEAGGADWIHVDVMDGMFVPNISLGPMVVAAIRRATRLPLDVHLMVEDPGRYLEAFRDAGADSMSIHLEADRHPHRTLGQIRKLGARAGLALNPGTPVEAASALLDSLDLLVVMSVNPGFGGQAFIPNAVDRVSRLRQLLAERQLTPDIEVDGGIKPENGPAVARAGATVLVAGSFVYQGGGGVESNLTRLRQAIEALTVV